jgi:HSP20 family molecular chaperone IbpA
METEKRTLTPIVGVSHKTDDSGFVIEVDLAGASKESVDLDMGTTGFCVKAEGEDFRYENCFTLGHEIKPAEAQAKFSSGLLKIEVPFRDSARGTKVTVH